MTNPADRFPWREMAVLVIACALVVLTFWAAVWLASDYVQLRARVEVLEEIYMEGETP